MNNRPLTMKLCSFFLLFKQIEDLAKLSAKTNKKQGEYVREALDDLLQKYSDVLQADSEAIVFGGHKG